MAGVVGTQVTVTTTATSLAVLTGAGTVYVDPVENGSSAVVRFGDASVTPAIGVAVPKTGIGIFAFQSGGGTLYGITQEGTMKVNVVVIS